MVQLKWLTDCVSPQIRRTKDSNRNGRRTYFCMPYGFVFLSFDFGMPKSMLRIHRYSGGPIPVWKLEIYFFNFKDFF